jgi:hypothetical protein
VYLGKYYTGRVRDSTQGSTDGFLVPFFSVWSTYVSESFYSSPALKMWNPES